jgi:predicted DNA-binding WGR domain protein
MVIEQIYLECVNDYSCKFYTAALTSEGVRCSVARCHGALGAPVPWSFKVRDASPATAQKAYQALIREKIRHSYVECPLPAYLKYNP